mmetsp:Transcript_10641/g.17368  ORF Transcript_10641/g.17368 Transcript_10641/m.17368 type:complete len:359 (+) Transcript_10641:539-1615(+)
MVSSGNANECREKLVASTDHIWTDVFGAPQDPSKVGVVLSGGVDTCAVCECLAELGVKPAWAFTVYANDSATDRPYAPLIAKQHGLKHIELESPVDELLQEPLSLCIRVLKTFDGMELRNSIVVARALLEAKKLGVKYVLTGDASDELMGGYSFTWQSDDPEWTQKRNAMCSKWFFSAPVLGKHLGITVVSPFMEGCFKSWALENLGKAECIGTRNLESFPNEEKTLRKTGKIPLREAFPDAISAWRRKDPIEVGSGSTLLSQNKGKYFSENKTSEDVEAEIKMILETDQVVIRDAEHLFYYRAFRKQFPDLENCTELPRRVIGGEDSCIGCHFQLPFKDTLFCKICGAWPARLNISS